MPLHIENSQYSKKLNRRVEFCIINERNIELKED